MNVKTCKKCGKLFQYSGIGEVFCPICKQKDEEDFEKVKKYINENPGMSIENVAEKTDVSVKLITKWIREERLILSKSSALLTCEKCGKPVASEDFMMLANKI